jgi:hypothetical protein
MIEQRPEPVSRREVLTKSLCTLALVAALTAVDAVRSEAQQKMAQKLVQYQQTPKKDQKCSVCLHFVPPDGCKVVDGKINPEGWCSLFAPKPKSK